MMVAGSMMPGAAINGQMMQGSYVNGGPLGGMPSSHTSGAVAKSFLY